MRSGVDLDAERDAAVHRDRQRLRAAHAAEARGERDRAGERAAEAPAGDLGEALVGALHDPLAADVDPRAGGHLAVHRQPQRLEPAELVPVRPVRRPGSSWRSGRAAPTRGCGTRRPACPTGPAASRRRPASRSVRDDRVEGVPGARRPPGAAVDDEVVGPLGDLGVEVVHQHPQRRLLRPAAAGDLGAARRADRRGGPLIASSSDRDDSTASDAASPGRDQRLGRGELGREPAVRSRPRDPRPAARRAPPPVPARRRAAARAARAPRAAQTSSTARIRRRLATRAAQLARRPPAHRDVVLLHRAGRQRVDARRERRAGGSRRPSPPACTGRSSARESTPGSSARNGGRPCERPASSSRSVRRSAIAPDSAAAIARKSQA